ncbi:MAG TPA: TIR domain-containing protein [Anaerolineales bacterium]|nr:TIR domain-containing protein [Anaerolineales bacterium]
MLTPTRIYISAPRDDWLQPQELDVKRGIIDRIKSAGFEPHELLISGDLSHIPWSYENIQHILGRCQGAVVLGLIRWDVSDAKGKYKFNTAYNHYEGALALAKNIPVFVLMHEHVYKAGIALKGRGRHFVRLPDRVDASWLQTDDFLPTFNEWIDVVRKRHHIFFGYSSKAGAAATRVKDFLTSKGVSVMEWEADLDPAASKVDEVERASKSCLGSIFLFTKDDETITGNKMILRAGYFMQAKGIDKTLMIREAGARMPVDIGGPVYLPLQNRNDISPIEKDLEKFIVDNL